MTHRIQRDSIAYKATCAILDHGPMPVRLLNSFVKLGETELGQRRNINSNIHAGWLVLNRDGDVDATPAARKQVEQDRQAANEKQYCEPVPSRSLNMMARPAYKSPSVYRREGPEWAKRPAGFSFKTVA